MSILPTDHNEIDSAIGIALDGAPLQELDAGGIYVSKDGNVFDTDKYLSVPRNYQRLNQDLDNVESFLAYLSAHDNGETEIWAHMNPSRTGVQIKAFLDAKTYARQLVTLRFDETRRWKEWQALNEKYVDQGVFAEFLEDHTEDLLEPDAATMLEVAQSLRASIKTDFQQSLRLDNGQTQLVYKEELEGKAGRAGKLTIPGEISISVQPYTTSELFKVKAKFRYRLNGGALSLGIKLMNTDRIIEHVFSQVVEKITSADIAPVFIGLPG